MLKKLIKYDLKYGIKIFLLLQSVQLIVAVIGRCFFFERVDYHAPSADLVSTLYLFFIFITLIFSIVSLGTMLLIAVRFYTNLFTDEGYLTWTIPVSPLQQLWSKLLSGSVWYILAILLSLLSCLILFSGENTYSAYLEIAPEITEALGMPLTKFIWVLLGESLLGTFSSVLMIYFCIVVGQLLPAHRLLGAVITYFALYFTTTAIISVFMLLFGLLPAIDTVNTANTVSNYVFSAIKITFLVYLVTGILEYLLVRWIMTKKMNLN